MMLTLPIYCAIIALASAMGGFVSTLVKLTHRKIQLTLSFVSGVMLGVALLHLLPHSIQKLGSPDLALAICLFGLLFMFFLIRMFHFHQHDLAVDTEHDHVQKELCDDDHDHHHVHCDHHHGEVDLSWVGLCFGLAIHTIIDGIALAAAVSGSSALSFAGLGVFLCISLGDLLPEVHFHSHDRLHLSLMLVLGVLLALAIEFLPGHSHNYSLPVDPQTNSAVSAVNHSEYHRVTF